MIKLKNESRQRQEWLKTLILLGLAVYFIILVLSGNLSNYINLRFIWLTYVGIFIFLLLGGWSAYRLLTGRSTQSGAHLPLSWQAAAIMGIPLLLALLVPSQPLGAEAISGGVSLQPIGGSAAAASIDRNPLDRNVLDWLRAFAEASTPAELNGLPVDVIAFVYREPDMAENQFMAARFTLSCCVADAFAIGLPVQYEDAGTLEEGVWIRIRGTLQAGEFNGDIVPLLHPESIEPVDTPQNPYLYS